MSRGFAIQYKIRKTTVNNKTGDNFSITIPKIIAQQFQDCLFRISVSGNSLVFESGCKMTINDIFTGEIKNDFIIAGGKVNFK